MKRLTKPDSKYTDFKNRKLQQYENTGLTPEEIAGLQEEALDVRPEVKWFAGEMEKQLGANEHKGGWQD